MSAKMKIDYPPGYWDLQSAEGTRGKVISIVGVVVDYMPATATRGTDYMLTLGLQDPSRLKSYHVTAGARVRYFAKLEFLPQIKAIGDIMLIRNISNKEFSGAPVFLSSWTTETIHFPAASIPDLAFHAAYEGHRQLEHVSYPHRATPPSAAEQLCVIQLRKWALDQPDLPSDKVQIAPIPPQPPLNAPTGPRDKFKFLKDVADRNYYDLVCEVRKVWGNGTGMDIYVTDYTSNTLFFDYKSTDDPQGDGLDGDQYGYTTNVVKKSWPGPFGKMTMQVRLWPPHNTFEVKEGDIVSLHNVNVRYRGSMCLEGSLHEDSRHPNQVDIRKISPMNKRVQELCLRREKYWASRDNQGNGIKRKKSKAEKKAARKKGQVQNQVQDQASSDEKKKSTNAYVVCAHSDRPVTMLPNILDTPYLKYRDQLGEERTLPFVNMKCRARIRVVDYYPSNLEDFTHSLDDSSYNNCASQPDEPSPMDMDDSSLLASRWEWAFYLLVEDARPVPGPSPVRMPLLVAGKDAEYLLKIDATDLRQSPTAVNELREKLFILWGNLEELKSAGKLDADAALSSKPFECCVMEYGVPQGEQWQRIHRMCMTTIK